MKLRKKTQKKRKVVINTASKLCDKLLNTYTTQYDKCLEDQKERGLSVVNKAEILILDFDRDVLPPTAELQCWS